MIPMKGNSIIQILLLFHFILYPMGINISYISRQRAISGKDANLLISLDIHSNKSMTVSLKAL